MKAIVIRAHGGPEVVELADLPEPSAGPGQVLVRVQAAPLSEARRAQELLADRAQFGKIVLVP